MTNETTNIDPETVLCARCSQEPYKGESISDNGFCAGCEPVGHYCETCSDFSADADGYCKDCHCGLIGCEECEDKPSSPTATTNASMSDHEHLLTWVHNTADKTNPSDVRAFETLIRLLMTTASCDFCSEKARLFIKE